MLRKDNLYQLPDDLPVPIDDGSCDHLKGKQLPNIELKATNGEMIKLSELKGLTVIYVYPRTGRPDREPPAGWNQIPGARGCTPQSCKYRDLFAELRNEGCTRIFGLSTQASEYQKEAKERLHLPFEILSDSELLLTRALQFPTFEVEGMILCKRFTIVILEGKIIHVFFPVFPSDTDAENVLGWIRGNKLN